MSGEEESRLALLLTERNEVIRKLTLAAKTDPTVLRALRAELHQHSGGHQPEVQAAVGRLGTVAARVIYHALRDLRSDRDRAHQLWRRHY